MPTHFNEMNELSNCPNMVNYLLKAFSKEIKLVYIMKFYRILFIFKAVLMQSLPLIFFLKSIELVSYYLVIKIMTLYNS